MKKFITADWHLGEDRFEIMARPFSSTHDMIETLITNYNEIVGPNDIVYVVGDVCRDKTPEFLPLTSDFNGRKILIRGNHDRPISDEVFLEYFENIIPEGDGIEIEIEEIPCYITHYPTQGKKDRFNLVGHIHSAWKYQLNMFNVGIDGNHFYPVNLETIPFHLKAISEFYDQDVWVAYNDINMSYKNHRGKSGSYFISS